MTGDDRQCCRRKIFQRITAFCDQIAGRAIIVYGPDWKFESEKTAAKFDEISRPTDCDRHIPNRIFQNQIPTDDPRDDLTESCVGISVRRTRDWDHRGKLGVTERGKSTG